MSQTHRDTSPTLTCYVKACSTHRLTVSQRYLAIVPHSFMIEVSIASPAGKLPDIRVCPNFIFSIAVSNTSSSCIVPEIAVVFHTYLNSTQRSAIASGAAHSQLFCPTELEKCTWKLQSPRSTTTTQRAARLPLQKVVCAVATCQAKHQSV